MNEKAQAHGQVGEGAVQVLRNTVRKWWGRWMMVTAERRLVALHALFLGAFVDYCGRDARRLERAKAEGSFLKTPILE